MPPQPAPWKPLLQHHLSLLKPPAFSLATLTSSSAPTNPTFSPSPSPPPSHPPSSPIPRVRTMIYRGFLAAIPPNPHNPLPDHNPPGLWECDCLTFTTDARSSKLGELWPETRSGGDARRGTGGGAEVEACFWVATKEEGEGEGEGGELLQNQWRVRGRCYLLAESDVEHTPAVTDLLSARMRPVSSTASSSWTWKHEVQSHFANLAPAMRGSFANPPPGTPLSVPLSHLDPAASGGGEKLTKGRPVRDEDVLGDGEDGHAKRARENFRVGVIVPEVVERVDLMADEARARRWVWWRVDEGEAGEGIVEGWKGVEVWP